MNLPQQRRSLIDGWKNHKNYISKNKIDKTKVRNLNDK